MKASYPLFMDKNLTVYPIASGDMLNIFASEEFGNIRIMDMAGNLVHNSTNQDGTCAQVNITSLASATYIVEVVQVNSKVARSGFDKI